jgi:hypothetical protein
VPKEASTVTHLSTLKDEMLVGTFSLPEGPRDQHLSTQNISLSKLLRPSTTNPPSYTNIIKNSKRKTEIRKNL